jgi:hypothetical protein
LPSKRRLERELRSARRVARDLFLKRRLHGRRFFFGTVIDSISGDATLILSIADLAVNSYTLPLFAAVGAMTQHSPASRFRRHASGPRDLRC